MNKQLDKNYDYKLEEALYSAWVKKGYFKADAHSSKEPYSIVIPPPNITGQLHMGHALNNTVQDILIRAKRMQGYEVLWLPGTDHAAIATEVRIVQEMAKEGETKESIGRDAFLKRAWEWKEEYGGTITKQLKKLGSSCDWGRERFTMDQGLSDAVLEVFIRLYEEDKIYRGERLVNWCVKCQTSISDAEVEHVDKNGGMYYFRYNIAGTNEYIPFATTRPETMLGDTAVAVNPSDTRFNHLVGKYAIIPSVGRQIPIISDLYVDPKFGTGAVKITPGHDHNDFEVARRHDLPIINILNDDGTINQYGGKYQGLAIMEARSAITKEMETLGLYDKTDNITHAVGEHDRCHETIEPIIKLQWFVKMQELAEPAIEAYKSGNLRFNRERFGKVYLHWLTNIKDWCISRQLWWGHRIPAYYCEDGHITVSKTQPNMCGTCKKTHLTQDEDTLDTWFSSALWPFSTMGWPCETEDLQKFYPTNVLVTAYEIIFFWVVRMVFMGLKFMGRLPFTDVFIHGIMRDSEGKKMSKSAGNGIDPLDVINDYGADALRLMLVSGNALDNDTRFFWERMDYCRNFLNKLWNASRFALGHMEESVPDVAPDNLAVEDKWILSLLNALISEVTEKLNDYELGMASQKIVDFIWDEFCDWYIEIVKPRLYQKDGATTKPAALWTLNRVLLDAYKLLHPFTPFVTETLFQTIQNDEETIVLSSWPKADPSLANDAAVIEMEQFKSAVRAVRNARVEREVPPAQKITLIIISSDEKAKELFNNCRAPLTQMAGAGSVMVLPPGSPPPEEQTVKTVIPGGVLYMPLSSLVDAAEEAKRLSKERERLTKEIARVDGKLSNEGFMAKAPPELIQTEKEKREAYIKMLEALDAQITP